MKPVAPVTRQTLSRERSTRLPLNCVSVERGAGSLLAPAQRRDRDVAHHRPVLAGVALAVGEHGVERPRNSAPPSSDSVSGGSSLITSFLPAAIVITPWSRCSGITTSCGNRPSLAIRISRTPSWRLARARRLQLDADHQPGAADLLDQLVALLQLRRPSISSAPICAARATSPSRSITRIAASPAAIDRRLRP